MSRKNFIDRPKIKIEIGFTLFSSNILTLIFNSVMIRIILKQFQNYCIGGIFLERKGITIYDIAKEAGVSPATVSRVLTGSTNVKSEKRDKITALIEKYNYKPNALARGLSDTKTHVIGILTADIRNPFYASVFVSCERAANKRGYTLVLCNSLNDNSMEEHYLEKFEEQRVDAIILVGGRVDELVSDPHYVEHINKISNSIPIVVTGKLDGTDCYQVNIDQVHAMELLMNHLFLLGHTEIALLGGRDSVKSTFEKRQRYRQLLNRQGLPLNTNLISEESGYDEIAGYNEMTRLFETGDIPTAVIAINDFAAVGIMQAIFDHGLTVPKDISVVSFDNTFVSGMATPKLTSIDYNYEQYGEAIITTAINILEHIETPRVQHFKSQLIIRDSCRTVSSHIS